MTNLTQDANGLDPAKHFFDSFPLPLTHLIALVGSSTGAVARRFLLGLYPRFPSSCPFRSCRSPVSSARHIARADFPHYALLHTSPQGLWDYPAGATAEAD